MPITAALHRVRSHVKQYFSLLFQSSDDDDSDSEDEEVKDDEKKVSMHWATIWQCL